MVVLYDIKGVEKGEKNMRKEYILLLGIVLFIVFGGSDCPPPLLHGPRGASLSIDSHNNPHLAYLYWIGKPQPGALIYNFWDGYKWSREIVYDMPDSLILFQLNDLDIPYIFFRNRKTDPPEMSLTWRESTGWKSTENIGNFEILYKTNINMAFDPQGRPGIVYISDILNYPSLNYAYWTGSIISITTIYTIDIYPISGELYTAFDPAGNPHILTTIYYYEKQHNPDGTLITPTTITATSILYGSWESAGWTMDTIGVTPGKAVPISLNFSATGQSNAWFWSSGGVMQLIGDGISWTSWILGSPGISEDIPFFLPRGINGNISIAYFTNTSIQVASWDGSKWNILFTTTPLPHSEDLECLAFDSLGHPHFVYTESGYVRNGCCSEKQQGSLKYGHWDGTKWVIETVE